MGKQQKRRMTEREVAKVRLRHALNANLPKGTEVKILTPVHESTETDILSVHFPLPENPDE